MTIPPSPRVALALKLSTVFILTLLPCLSWQSKPSRVASPSDCPHQCSNHGDCVHGENDVFFCQCQKGWTGKSCNHTCERNCGYGTCQLSGHMPVCVCPIGYHGDNCQHKNINYNLTSLFSMAKRMSQFFWSSTSPLILDPRPKMEELIDKGAKDCGSTFQCHNGGKCRHGTAGGYRCQCLASKFTGDFCQFTCPHICLNGGTCIRMRKPSSSTRHPDLSSFSESDFDYGCVCPKDYFGKICQRERASTSLLSAS